MSFISKLKSALGKSKDTETTSASDTIESIINDIEHEPFAVSEHNVLYAGLNELGGYFFFQTVIVGSFHIKTKKGATLQMIGDDFELNLDSDMLELESDQSDVAHRSISKIDFQIEAEDAEKITKAKPNHLVLNCKTYEITFKTVESKKTR